MKLQETMRCLTASASNDVLGVNGPSICQCLDRMLAVLLVPVVFCSQGCVLTLHTPGNATCFRLEVLSMGNAVCSLSSMGYRNKRLFLCFDGHQDEASA